LRNFAFGRIGIDRSPRNPGALFQTKHRHCRACDLFKVFALLLVMLGLVWKSLPSSVRSAVSQLGVTSEPGETLRKTTAIDNDQAKVLQRIDHVGLRGECPAIGCFGLGELALLEQNVAEIAVCRRVVWRNRREPPEHNLSFGRLALPLQGNAQAIVDDRMIGQELQNIAVKPLRFRQPPSAMVADGRLQLGFKLSGLWKVCHRLLPRNNNKFTRTELKMMINLWELNWKSGGSSFNGPGSA